METIRVFVALEHALLRGALQKLVSEQQGMALAGASGDSAEVIALVAARSPHVVVTDAWSSEPSGIAWLGQLRHAAPNSHVLVLALSNDATRIRRTLEAGASGCVGLLGDERTVVAAIRELHQGGTFIDPTLAAGVVQNVIGYRGATHSAHKLHDSKQLSPREIQVLKYLIQGYTNQQIADDLVLSVKTTETYRARLKRKLGLRNRADIVRYGMEIGLLGRTDSEPAVPAA
jgi:two-component system response regulator NreC